MRKILMVIIAFLLIMCVFMSTAFALNQYDINELGMSISVPEDFMVFTRNTNVDDPNLSTIDMNVQSLKQQFTQNNIYLDAIKSDYSTQIIVTMSKDSVTSDIYDLNLCTDEKKVKIAEEERKTDALKQANVQYTGYEFLKNNQASFICFNISSASYESNLYSKQYFTIINGQAINIILYSNTSSVSAEQENILTSVIDSISFKQVKQKHEGLFANVTWVVVLGIISLLVVVIFVFFKRAANKNKQSDNPKGAHLGL